MFLDQQPILDCAWTESWNGLQQAAPINPFDLIAYAMINGGGGPDVGVFLNSTTFVSAPVWTLAAFPVSSVPVCSALESDNNLANANAANWNFNHLTINTNSSIAPQLQGMLFMRGGDQWMMNMQLNFGANFFSDIQISILDNASTRGDCHGTIPVIAFNTNTYTGTVALNITLKPRFGSFRIGIRAIGGPHGFPPNWYMWDSVWVVVR